MLTVYVYSKCSTCKNALAFLERNKITFNRKEITETPPSVKDLKIMLQHYQGDIKKLFNTSGNLYKELNLKEKLRDMSTQECLHLLSQNGMLVKRPFVIGKDFGLVGFNEATWIKIHS